MEINKDRFVKIYILAIIVVFILWGFFDIFVMNKDFIADRFLVAGIGVVAFFTYKKLRIELPVLLLGLIPISLHSWGDYNWSFIFPFDQYLHFTSGVVISMIFYRYIYSLAGGKKHLFSVFFLTVCVVAALGSILEIVEYLGYVFGGEGGGILFYGAGDHGGWSNAIADMICNTLGAIVGYFVMLIRKH